MGATFTENGAAPEGEDGRGPSPGSRSSSSPCCNKARVDALGGEGFVDRPRPTLLENDPGDANEAIPHREIANRRAGSESKAVRALLNLVGVILENLTHVHPGITSGHARLDVHLAQGEHGRLLTAGARGHERTGLGLGRRHVYQKGQTGEQAKGPRGYR
jgi:hypothetical protein